MRYTKHTTIPTFRIAPIDYNKATTTVFMEELCEMNLRGLRIRNSLSTLMIGRLTLVKLISMSEQITMNISN
jgi:hypothetical protein